MHSLFVGSSVLFWIAMAPHRRCSIRHHLAGVPAREYESPGTAAPANVAIQASEVSEKADLTRALKEWLDANKNSMAESPFSYIIGPDGKDILRPAPPSRTTAVRRLELFHPSRWKPRAAHQFRSPPPPGNFSGPAFTRRRSSARTADLHGIAGAAAVPAFRRPESCRGISLTILCSRWR